MGQEYSSETVEVSKEQLSQELALKFAKRCYTQLELYCFKEVFRKLADHESGLRYWSEGTLCRFLELPDVLGAGPVVFAMVTWLGAFPFASQAPCIVTMESLIKVITLLTARYKVVLRKGESNRTRLLYGSLAVFDKQAGEELTEEPEQEEKDLTAKALDEAIKQAKRMELQESGDSQSHAVQDEDEDDDDDLTMAALDSLDAIEAIGFGDRPDFETSIIPTDNFLRLTQLLLLAAPVGSQESLSQYAENLSGKNLDILRAVSGNILSTFGVEDQPGITYRDFKTVVPHCLPHIFEGFNSLFEHFLFEKDFDLSRRRKSVTSPPTSPVHESPPKSPTKSSDEPAALQPLLSGQGEILNEITIRQLSCFIEPATLFRRLHFLYSGSTHGFSMGSFEKSVFNWNAPTILLVSGTLLSDEPSDSRERTFADSLLPKRFPNGNAHRSDRSTRVTYGAYVSKPWKHSHKEPFGDTRTSLFQLAPLHDVFPASTVSTDYVTYTAPTPTAVHPGVNFGSHLTARASGLHNHVPLGPVSLYLDPGLEFAVFTHTAAGGGSYRSSVSPARNHHYGRHKPPSVSSPTRPRVGSTSGARRSSMSAPEAKPGDWQDRFEIESLEVWGLGGEEEAIKQRKAVEWEEREARLRKETIIGKGDREADKEILRMAGLIGRGQEGGSII